MTFPELVMIKEGEEEAERERYEILAYVVRAGVASALNGGDIKLFEDKKESSGTITQEEREETLKYLDSIL